MDLLKYLNSRILKLNNVRFSLFLFMVTLTKSGLSPIGSEFVGWLRDTSRALPRAITYLVSSPLPLILMRILNYPNDWVWWGLGFALYVSWVWLTTFFLWRRFPGNEKVMSVLFAASVPFSSAAMLLGHIDIYVLIGATLAVLARFRGHIFLGALISIGGNADQAIASSVCLLLLFMAGSHTSKKLVKTWIPLSVLTYLVIHLVFKIENINDPKLVILGEIKNVTLNSIGVWDLTLYSQMGILWLPWLFFILPHYKGASSKFFALLGVVILPLGMSFFILDGTKIGTTVGFLTLLASLLDQYDKLFFREQTNNLLVVIGFLLIVTVPTIIVGNGGVLRLPYRKLITHFLKN